MMMMQDDHNDDDAAAAEAEEEEALGWHNVHSNHYIHRLDGISRNAPLLGAAIGYIPAIYGGCMPLATRAAAISAFSSQPSVDDVWQLHLL